MTPHASTLDRLKKTWPDWLNASVGAWMVLSAFVPMFSGPPPGPLAAGATGVAVLLVSSAAVARMARWKQWANLTLGLWLIGAPWALGIFAFDPFWNYVGDGAFLAFHAAYQLARPPRQRDGF